MRSNLLSIVQDKNPKLYISFSEKFEHSPVSRDINYWIYVEPISGRYVLFGSDPRTLLVFLSPAHGRQEESNSALLSRCVGHEVNLDELQLVANMVSDGRWRIQTDSAVTTFPTAASKIDA